MIRTFWISRKFADPENFRVIFGVLKADFQRPLPTAFRGQAISNFHTTSLKIEPEPSKTAHPSSGLPGNRTLKRLINNFYDYMNDYFDCDC